MREIIFSVILLAICNDIYAECVHVKWITYEEDELFKSSAGDHYAFQTEYISIDADGAPNAYHPDNTGLDYLANAGYPNTKWWPSVIVKDPKNPKKGYIQTDGEFIGYFVSKTSLYDPSKSVIDPDRYVDSTKIPYLVFPRTFYKLQGTGLLGDLGLATHGITGKTSAFVVADIGPSNKPLGEISIKLAEMLGGTNVNPRNAAGAAQGKTTYTVFPYSSKTYKWPLNLKEIELSVKALVSAAKDLNSLKDCY